MNIYANLVDWTMFKEYAHVVELILASYPLNVEIP
jgi:hypothetical protein